MVSSSNTLRSASTFRLSFCSSLFSNKNRKRGEKRANYCIVSALLIHRLLIFARATRERRRHPLAVRRRLVAHRRVLKVLGQRSGVEWRQGVRARDSRGRRDQPPAAQRRRRPARVQVAAVDRLVAYQKVAVGAAGRELVQVLVLGDARIDFSP